MKRVNLKKEMKDKEEELARNIEEQLKEKFKTERQLLDADHEKLEAERKAFGNEMDIQREKVKTKEAALDTDRLELMRQREDELRKTRSMLKNTSCCLSKYLKCIQLIVSPIFPISSGMGC